MKEKVGLCERCFNLAEGPLCRICADPSRDEATICVVEEPADVIPIERTHEYRGLYHVLGGALSPIDGIDAERPQDRRAACAGSSAAASREVVLATNPTTTGEATALHIAELLRGQVTVTRLASGLPVGADLEHADEVTLGKALAGRRASTDAARLGRVGPKVYVRRRSSLRKLRVFGARWRPPLSPRSAGGCSGWQQRIDGSQAERRPAAELAREVSALQATLLGRLREEMAGADVEPSRARRSGWPRPSASVTAAAVEPRRGAAATAAGFEDAAPEPLPARPDAPPARPADRDATAATSTRSGWSSSTSTGPGRATATAAAPRTALAVVDAALRDSVRLVDETFRLEEDALCVLAPNQDTVGGVQMSERLLACSTSSRRAGGLPIGISAGVVACPEHGNEADELLRKADEAMWRARAVGQPVGVGRALQDR